jgi:hypothetical protein
MKMQKKIVKVSPAAFAHLMLEFEDGTKQMVKAGDMWPPDGNEHVTSGPRSQRYIRTMRVTLKTVNDQMANRGYSARLVKASGYFYFEGGEADDWLDKTVNMPTVNSIGLAEWMAEFDGLKTVNDEIMGGVKGGKLAPKRKRYKNKP